MLSIMNRGRVFIYDRERGKSGMIPGKMLDKFDNNACSPGFLLSHMLEESAARTRYDTISCILLRSVGKRRE